MLRASPSPGFRFAGWDGLAGLQTNSVRLQLNGDYAITARFEPDLTTLPRFTSIRRLPDTRLQLSMAALPGTTNALEPSTDLHAWTTEQPLLTSGADGKFEFVGTSPAGGPARFYRLRLR